MTTSELISRLEAAERELADIRRHIIDNGTRNAHATHAREGDHEIGYTLNDLYQAFGKRKQPYATRLAHALERQGIATLPDFLALSPGQLLELDNVGFGTLQQTKKALDRLGVAW